MRFLSSFPKLNTFILIVLAVAWLYTEITEYHDRQRVVAEFTSFINAGGRFTEEEGAALEQRIKELEKCEPSC